MNNEILELIREGKNPIECIESEKDIDLICKTICKPEGAKDPFWDDMAQILLKAIICYLQEKDNETKTLKRCKEIVEAVLGSDEPKALMENLFEGIESDSSIRMIYKPIEIAPPRTYKSIVEALNEKLAKFEERI